MLGLHGVLNLFVYHRLLLRRSLIALPEQPKLETIERRVSFAGPSARKPEIPTSRPGCSQKILCIKDQPEFSIFDGTNASGVWGEFIDESSDCDEDAKPEAKPEDESSDCDEDAKPEAKPEDESSDCDEDAKPEAKPED
eukprot:CAMPEP_0171324020 /NCGR_PEP_ID=MMETSP0816-20121228/115929_1 /TAXON_ID=420281 /ORGANISM="Proboscia inermis, Strain CCAP1064/1" /LENGTH=138 /DNA_ID=CAMNT_0011822855 /DNA_START=207 /DNA_END=623 /DNA_ORIENTATION=-